MSLPGVPFEGTGAEWDAFAAGQRGFTHYHRYGWKELIEATFGHECVYLAARDESGALAAVLPLVRVKSLVFGHFLVSMPFLNYGGPLSTAAMISNDNGMRQLEILWLEWVNINLRDSHIKIINKCDF